jgi:hypothetical protein
MSLGWYSAASGHRLARAEPDLFVLDLPTYRHAPDGLASADAVDDRDRYAEAVLRQGWGSEFFEKSDLRPNLPGSRCEVDGTDSTPSNTIVAGPIMGSPPVCRDRDHSLSSTPRLAGLPHSVLSVERGGSLTAAVRPR